uniref:Uncharacterized protein n=1 Tax=Talaromyces marneffei PM1 TaxID=1077442 RepID=A0A093VQR3_TALMA
MKSNSKELYSSHPDKMLRQTTSSNHTCIPRDIENTAFTLPRPSKSAKSYPNRN